jgi:5-formyltetrahydrofolate cyclo-ligase
MVAPRIPMKLEDTKQAQRIASAAARAGHDPVACGAALAAHVLRDLPPSPGAVVAGFWPLEGEIDVRPLLHALHDRGHDIVLPITPKRGAPLTFGLWRPGDTLVPERFGTFRPTGPAGVPTFLLVPLLAFDRAGHRLGYGAGFYDRTLPLLPGRFALGCAFAAQEVDEVPVGPYDIPLDAMATEWGVMRCGPPPQGGLRGA